MGIRFRCPNGHSLHVKAFLAGKRGICPECGQKFTIPQTSDPEVVAARVAKRAASAVSTPTASPEVVATEPNQDVTAVASRPKRDESEKGGNWYVRPPAGGQFGPADERLFAQWLAEGRVPRDSYVWREGWSEWQPATKILPAPPDSASQATPASPDVPRPMVEETPKVDGTTSSSAAGESPDGMPKVVVATSESPTLGSYRRQKASRTMGIVIAILTLACIALFAALIFVIRG